MSNLKTARRSYIIGYILSVLLTIAAFATVGTHLSTHHQTPSDQIVMTLLIVFAISQLIVQVIFFLHLGKEPKPRLNLMSFLFMILIVVIIVFGSLWIMKNLNYHMLRGTDVDKYIIQDEGIHR